MRILPWCHSRPQLEQRERIRQCRPLIFSARKVLRREPIEERKRLLAKLLRGSRSSIVLNEHYEEDGATSSHASLSSKRYQAYERYCLIFANSCWAEGLWNVIIAACRARFLFFPIERIRGDRNDRDRSYSRIGGGMNASMKASQFPCIHRMTIASSIVDHFLSAI